MSKATKKKTARKATTTPPLNGTWRISRFPDKASFPPTEEPDGELTLDIDSTGKLTNASNHQTANGVNNPIAGKASAKAVRFGHTSGKRAYVGVLVHDGGGVMKLAGFFRITNITVDQEQGTWTGTKP